jgi:hypothetical protein
MLVAVSGETTGDTAIVVIVVLGIVAAALVVSMRLVGQVAAQFGEEPRRWQLLMLPLGIFGPLVAWAILSRRNWH